MIRKTMIHMDVDDNLDQAMVNSYEYIILGKTIEELFEDNPEALLLMFDPDEFDRVDVINDLLTYFEEMEEYEKCANLKSAKKNELL